MLRHCQLAILPNPTAISILLHSGAQPSFALLAASVFRIGNRLSGVANFDVRLIGHAGIFEWEDGEIRLQHLDVAAGGYLVVPPMHPEYANRDVDGRDIAMLRQAAAAEMTIAGACLGAFLPAAAGLLDGRQATTHWNWVDIAARRFPAIRWNARDMLVDHGDVVTSGGLLSIVDLCLHIVRKTRGAELAQQLAQTLLADTIRQKQSVYASRLVAEPRDTASFKALETEIDRRNGAGPTIPEMADFCKMSLRTFHRRFQENYGVSPVKFLQLRRIEKVKSMLAQEKLPLDVVAERAGFSDMAFFRSVFARETGMTPGQYRRNLGALSR